MAINKRGEIAFTVANNDDPVPYQGLVFYRNHTEGLRSVFKSGDTCVSDLRHPAPEYQTGMVFGLQGLDGAPIPRAFATLNPALVLEGVPTGS